MVAVQAYMHLIKDDLPEEIVSLGVFEGESLLRQPGRQLNVIPRDRQMDQGRRLRGLSFDSEVEDEDEDEDEDQGDERVVEEKMEEKDTIF